MPVPRCGRRPVSFLPQVVRHVAKDRQFSHEMAAQSASRQDLSARYDRGMTGDISASWRIRVRPVAGRSPGGRHRRGKIRPWCRSRRAIFSNVRIKGSLATSNDWWGFAFDIRAQDRITEARSAGKPLRCLLCEVRAPSWHLPFTNFGKSWTLADL